METRFNERKATQLVALVVNGLTAEKTILTAMKIAYLIDREALLKFKTPFTGDKYVAMKNGMVLSNTYNLWKRERPSAYWDEHIGKTGNRDISVRSDPGTDEFSEAELEFIYERLGKYVGKGLDYLIDDIHHRELPEWEDPGESKRKMVAYEDLLHKMDYTDNQIQYIQRNAEVSSFFESVI